MYILKFRKTVTLVEQLKYGPIVYNSMHYCQK